MGIGWKEYDDEIDTAVDELEAEDKLLSEVLETHREAFNPDAKSNSATEKFMAELLVNAPELNLYELLAGETYVDWDNGFSNFTGTFTPEELVVLLYDNDLLVERGQDVYGDFLTDAAKYRQLTDVYFGGELWEEQQLNNELGRNFRLREEFASAQPNRILPALQEHNPEAFQRVVNLTPPGQRGDVSNVFIDEVVKQIELFGKDPTLIEQEGVEPAEEEGVGRVDRAPRTPQGRGEAPEAPQPTGVETGTRAREGGTVAALEPETARRPVFGLPPSERLDTMGPRPDFRPGMSDAEVRQVLRDQRAYDAEVERRTRLEEDLAARQMRSDAIFGTRSVLEQRLEETRRAEEIEKRRREFIYNWSGQAAAAEARAEAIARVSGPDALERARLTARNMRIRGRGDARESFEEGMAQLRESGARTPVASPVSRPPTEDGRTAAGAAVAADTFSPEAVRRVTTATTAKTAADDAMGLDLASITAQFGTADAPSAAAQQAVSGAATTTTTGPARLSAAQIREANQAEVELLLAQQFGGFSFFLQKHRSDLQVGLTADGQVVAADDPNAATVKNILDVIVDQGITAPTRVLGLLENTEWWQKTDAKMREYDVLTADMSEPQKLEYLEPVLDTLRDEAQFLGFQLDPTRARDLAEQITRMGEEGDAEYIRGLLTAEGSFNAAEVTASSFAAARDEIVAMSKRYFAPINEADAAAFAQDIYVGTKTAEGVEQYFREMAANKFPQLQNSLNAGITPEQYFAPYKYEIERMLDRPNVDLYEEFGDVIQYIPDTGTGEARPMTLGEVRKYVRGLDEWQQSSQGTDSARALAFSIGRVFGEVA